MPIDPTGTSPVVTPSEQEPKKHHMRCKRDGCDSIYAIEVQIPTLTSSRMYRCAKCHHSHHVLTGGTFNY